jgi:hypothetical protein
MMWNLSNRIAACGCFILKEFYDKAGRLYGRIPHWLGIRGFSWQEVGRNSTLCKKRSAGVSAGRSGLTFEHLGSAVSFAAPRYVTTVRSD